MDDTVEPFHCPTCGSELVNGARFALAETITPGAQVEVRTNAGARIGYFFGYLVDGRVEVIVDGQRFDVAADTVTPHVGYLQPKEAR